MLFRSGLSNDPVNIAKCGLVVESGNADEIVKGILIFKSMNTSELRKMGLNGYSYLMKNQTYKVIGEKYYSIVQKFI